MWCSSSINGPLRLSEVIKPYRMLDVSEIVKKVSDKTVIRVTQTR